MTSTVFAASTVATDTSSFHLRRARILIDDQALLHNLKRVKDFASSAKVVAVIKADAYGHGLIHVAHVLAKQVDCLAVAMPAEAFALRQSGIKRPILVLQGVRDVAELGECALQQIEVVVHQAWQVDLLEQLAAQASAETQPLTALKVWLKLDTGMHRLGISPDEVGDVIARIKACEQLELTALMSHFSNADEFDNNINNNQLSSLVKVNNRYGFALSIANSAAIISRPDSHFDFVRPGIMLYGSSPLPEQTAQALDLQAVMNFESELIAINKLKAGDAIGYGGDWNCPEDMIVGIVAAGYGDGYPRHACSMTPVWLNGHRCGLLGRVSMDSICIDLRGVEADIGDRVVLWGRELPVDEVAASAETIAYELLCHAGGLSKG